MIHKITQNGHLYFFFAQQSRDEHNKYRKTSYAEQLHLFNKITKYAERVKQLAVLPFQRE